MLRALSVPFLARFLALHRSRPNVQMISDEEAKMTNAGRGAVIVGFVFGLARNRHRENYM